MAKSTFLIVALLNFALVCYARPQDSNSDRPKCDDFPGYRCVSAIKCLQDEDFANKPQDEASVIDEVFLNDGRDDLGIRNQDRPEDAVCFELADIRNDEPVCCKEANIVPDVPSNSDSLFLCSEFQAEGYKCVAENKCMKRVLGEKQSDLAEGAICVDSSIRQQGQGGKAEDVCCHPNNIIEDDGGLSCFDLPGNNHRCVPAATCVPKNFTIKQDSLEDAASCLEPSNTCCHVNNIVDDDYGSSNDPVPCTSLSDHRCVKKDECQPDVRGSTNQVNGQCTDPRQGGLSFGEVCCHLDDIVEEPKPKSCSVYERDGYNCEAPNNCLDEIISHGGEGLFGVRQADIPDDEYMPRQGVCEEFTNGQRHVCCLETKPKTVPPPVSLQNCESLPGYKCIPGLKCGDGETITPVDIRQEVFLIEDKDRICPGDQEICCKPKENIDDKTVPVPGPPKVDYIPRCGQHNPQGLDIRVANPNDEKFATQFGEWPHACLLIENEDGTDFMVGGASLIARGIVLTAAHKVLGKNAAKLSVTCGEWNVKNHDEPRREQTRRVKEFVIHPSFSGIKRVLNDHAILIMEEDFFLSEHIDTICLPEFPNQKDGQYLKTGCVAMGWGAKRFQSNMYQAALRQIELPIVTNPWCEAAMKQTRLGQNFRLHKSFICAGGKAGEDTCEGDGGGSLVCQHPNDSDRWVIAGITAWGIGCGVEGRPGVYADVADGLCFIDWATKCKTGQKYRGFINYPQCNGWIDREISSLSRSSDPKAPSYLNKARSLKESCPIDLSDLEKRDDIRQ